jgi:V8-like Glu-specific endopeptidase
VAYRHGRTKTSYLPLITALFMLCSLSSQAKDYTQAVGAVVCDGAIRGIATHIQLPDASNANQSIIVTAAHVLYNPLRDQLFNQCHYRPHNKRLSGIAFEAISKHNYSVKNKDKIAQAVNDLVFIRLKKRAHQPSLKLTEDLFSKVSEFSFINPIADGFKQTSCQKIDHPHLTNDRLLLHDCPAKKGTSGSPIIDSKSGEIIAVHGGRLTVKVAKNGDENTPWIGQARRIDLIAASLLNRLTSEQIN